MQKDGEEKFSLAGKGKGKVKGSGGFAFMKDMRKVKFLAYHKTGHYASQCPHKEKKEDQVVASASTKIDKFIEFKQ